MAEVLGVAASAIAVVELSVNIILLCSQYLKDVGDAERDIKTLKEEVTNLKTLSESVRELLNTPQGGRLKASQKLGNALKSSQSQLESLEITLNSRIDKRDYRINKKKRRRLHTLKWPFESKDTAKLVHDIARCAQAVSMGLQVDQTAILLTMDQKMVLDKLPVVEEAMFDSHAEEHNPTCLQGTRIDILQDIQNWAGSPQEKPVFWLNGMAGTGKSTISRTAARLLSERGQLGASFFFKRGEQDRGTVSKFFPTIAAQLVKRELDIAPYVKEAIDNNSDIFGKGIETQFEKLVLAPFSQISQDERKTDTLVIIIDALDECDREEDIQLLIRLLSRANHQDLKLRIFVTSRPELPIRLGFSKVKGTYRDFTLHTIPDTVVESDLKTYFNHELARIRDDYNDTVSPDRKLPSTWPGQSVIDDLAKIASPLFIFAATVCRFLDNRKCGPPDKKLEKVLQYKTKGQESKLDATYLPILDQMMDDLSEGEQKEALEEFQTIVGSIVVLFDPLSTSALAAVLQVSQNTIDARLDLLHSVLDIPPSPGLPVKPLHLSFCDFLLDPEKKGRSQFWVDEREMHRQMAKSCVYLLNNSLRKDICEVRWPGTLRESIDSKIINEKLPPEVQYACQYWTLHLQQSGDKIDENDLVHNFLQRHSLHWLEALCLLGKSTEAGVCIRMLLSRSNLRFPLQPQYRVMRLDLMQAFDQIEELAKRFEDCPTPLQIYSEAALLDWKFEHFHESDRPDWIIPGPESISFDISRRTPIAISSDSKFIAAQATDNDILICSLDTGIRRRLRCDVSKPKSIALSPNAKFLLSTWGDNTVRIWSDESGQCLRTITLRPISNFELSFDLDGRIHPSDVGARITEHIPKLACAQAPKGPLVPNLGLTLVKDSDANPFISWITIDGLRLWYIKSPFSSRQHTVASGSVVAIISRSRDEDLSAVRIDIKRLLELRPGSR